MGGPRERSQDADAPGAFLGRWTKLLSQAGVTYREPHALRHTYASLLIQSEESLAYVRIS
jgi:integrase